MYAYIEDFIWPLNLDYLSDQLYDYFICSIWPQRILNCLKCRFRYLNTDLEGQKTIDILHSNLEIDYFYLS